MTQDKIYVIGSADPLDKQFSELVKDLGANASEQL